MYLVLESILFVLTEGCSWRVIDRPKARWNSMYQYFRRWCQTRRLKESADPIRARTRTGMALRRQHPR